MLHFRGQILEPGADGVQPPVGVAQHILGRPAVGENGDLGDEPDPLARRDRGRSLVCALLAAEDAEERRLAAAVRTEDADMLAGVDREGQPVEYFFADLKGFFEVFYRNVDHSPFLVTPPPRWPRAGSSPPPARR